MSGPHREVEMPVVQDMPGLPHSRELARYRLHLKQCEPCAEVHDGSGACFEYCDEGHKLVHKIEELMDRMKELSVLN